MRVDWMHPHLMLPMEMNHAGCLGCSLRQWVATSELLFRHHGDAYLKKWGG